MHFPFQEIYKEYAQFSAKKHLLRRFKIATSEHAVARHQKMVKQNQNMVYEVSEEHEFRSRSTEVLMVSRSSTSKSEDRKMLCTKLLDSDYSNVVSTNIKS